MCCTATRSDCQLTWENERLLQMLTADACLDRGHALPSCMNSQQSSHSILHCCCANEAISQEQPRRVSKPRPKGISLLSRFLCPSLSASCGPLLGAGLKITHKSVTYRAPSAPERMVGKLRSLQPAALKLKQPHFRHFYIGKV